MMASPFRTAKEREATREEKRDAVLRTAVRMFNDNGFHATSLEEVASRLGVSKPTIYHYLGSKDLLLFECVTRGLEQLRDAADAARAKPGSGLDRLRGFLVRYAEITMTDFGRCVIGTSEQSLSEESAARFRGLKRGVDLALRRLIEDGIADGSIATDDVRLTAFTLAGALNWTAKWYRDDGPTSAPETARRIADILTQGIAPR